MSSIQHPSLYETHSDQEFRETLLGPKLNEVGLGDLEKLIFSQSCRGIYEMDPSQQKRGSGHDSQTHFSRINFRSLVRGCKNPFQILFENYHDTLEYLVGMQGVMNQNPNVAKNLVLGNMFALLKDRFSSTDEAVEFIQDLHHATLTLTRPFQRQEYGSHCEVKDEPLPYFRNILVPNDQMEEIRGERFNPGLLYPLPLFVKAGDKEDNIDFHLFNKVRRTGKKETVLRNLFEGYLLLFGLLDAPEVGETPIPNMHPSYTTSNYRRDYVQNLINGLGEDIGKLRHNLCKSINYSRAEIGLVQIKARELYDQIKSQNS